MKQLLISCAALILAGCVTPGPRDRAMQRDQEVSEKVLVVHRKAAPSPATLAEHCKISLSTAVDAAVKKVPGKALGAEIEMEGGKAVIEVQVFSDGKLWEVEIDGTTGAVLEVEQDDDDDDEDDEDDDD